MDHSPEQVPLSSIVDKQIQILLFSYLYEELLVEFAEEPERKTDFPLHPELADVNHQTVTLADTEHVFDELLTPGTPLSLHYSVDEGDREEIREHMKAVKETLKIADLGINQALIEFNLIADYSWDTSEYDDPIPPEIFRELAGKTYRLGMKINFQGQCYVVCRLDASSNKFKDIGNKKIQLPLKEGDLIPLDTEITAIELIHEKHIDTDS